MPRTAALAGAALLVLGAGCGDQRSATERFCERLQEEVALLSDVPSTPEGLRDLVTRYRDLEAAAPLAIEEDWRAVADLVEETVTADLTDPATADRLREQALGLRRAIERIAAFTDAECGVVLGPLVDTGTVPGTLPPSGG